MNAAHDNDCFRNALYSHWCQQIYICFPFSCDFDYRIFTTLWTHTHWHFISIYHHFHFYFEIPHGWVGARSISSPFCSVLKHTACTLYTRLTSGWFSLSPALKMDSILVHIVWNKFCPDSVTLWYRGENMIRCAFIRPFIHPKLKCIIDKHF